MLPLLLAGSVLLQLPRLTVALSVAGVKSQTTNSPSAIVGTWTGDSVCLVKPSACTDEASVYRISIPNSAKATVAIEANKIVNGKEVRMGVTECAYDLLKRHITCTLPNENVLTFDVASDRLTGTMTLKDGTRWRTITLRKSPPESSLTSQ
jgi:hypothetical protein